ALDASHDLGPNAVPSAHAAAASQPATHRTISASSPFLELTQLEQPLGVGRRRPRAPVLAGQRGDAVPYRLGGVRSEHMFDGTSWTSGAQGAILANPELSAPPHDRGRRGGSRVRHLRIRTGPPR